jgi:hypothetical protein
LKIVKIGKYVIPLWLMAVVLVSGIGSGVLGYYVWRTLTIPLEVKEPIEILHYPSQLSLYPGETEEFNITVQNHASVNYSVTLDFSLDNTTYQNNYVTFSNEIYTVIPGQQNLTAWVMVESHAPQVNASLTIDFKRGPYPSGLVGYWKFDEGSGTTACDSSVNNNTGTLNGPSWVDGKYGKALAFDGIDDYVGIPTLLSLSPTSLTVTAWIKSPFNHAGYIFYHGDNGEFLLHNGERLRDGPVSGRFPDLASFSVKIQGTWYDVYSPPLTPNAWHHITGVWIKGVSLKIYVDGALAGENTAIPDYYLFDPGSSYSPSMGVYCRGVEQDTFFEGLIDEVRIYNRTLNAEEILAYYTSPPV